MAKKNVLIVTDYALHQKSGAAYARMECYRKALGEQFSFYALEMDQFYTSRQEIEFESDNPDSIFFISLPELKRGFFYRNFLKLFDFVRPIRLVKQIKKNYHKEDTFILLYSSHFLLFIITIIYLKKIYKFEIVVEKNELEISIILNSYIPLHIKSLTFLLLFPIKFILALFTDLAVILASKVIVISANLKELYRFCPNLYKIPILVNMDRFKKSTFKKYEKADVVKFVYLGFFTKKKDSIFDIFQSINRIKNIILNEAVFYFIGDGSKKIKKMMHKYINDNALQELIKIKSSVISYEVPKELCQYHVALLIRNKNLQTKYGFATKIGEYLAAGLPVLTNDVSDNALYLKDNDDSFFIKTLTIEEISSKIEAVISLKDGLNEMRQKAITTAKSNFDSLKYQEQLRGIFS